MRNKGLGLILAGTNTAVSGATALLAWKADDLADG